MSFSPNLIYETKYIMKKNIFNNFQNNALITVSILLIVSLLIRCLINFWLFNIGYFYGIPWDSFSRTLISYQWADRPFFSTSDGYWLPLQFWVVGLFFALIRPIYPASNMFVPVIVNHLFFVGSLIVVYLLAKKLSRKSAGMICCLIAVVFAGDVFTTYSGLSEPLLIFLILLDTYLVYIFLTTKDRLKLVVPIGFVTGLATATHYIGWFLGVFIGIMFFIYFLNLIKGKKYRDTMQVVIGVILVAVMPVLWLLNSWNIHGSPFYAMTFAKDMQANYIGQMTLFERFINMPGTFAKDFPAIAIAGFLAGIYLLFKNKKMLVYLLPGGFTLCWIWLSTTLAFSAPYQEPRYLVFGGWLLIPMISIALVFAWSSAKKISRILIIVAAVGFIASNLYDINHFRNSFDLDVRAAGQYAYQFLKDHPQNGSVILQNDSFAERGPIRVLAGYPNRVELIPTKTLEDNLANPKQFFDTIDSNWVVIIKDENFAMKAQEQGYEIQQEGSYYYIVE